MKLFLTIFLFLPFSLAFSIGKCIMRVEDLRLMSKEDDVEPQRKPRFAQQVHVTKKIQSSKNLSSDKPHTRKVSDENTRKSSGKILQEFTAQGNENVPQKSNESPSGLGKDFMWKTGKSIEDIEATMAKRWGTEVEKWTANPEDYELEEDSPSIASQSQKFYRGKPVADPWEVKERKSKPLPTYSETDRLPSDFGEKRVLDKARRNQQDIQSKARVKKPSWTNLVDDEVTSVSDRDFYDEDDEGFETDDPRGKKKSTSSIGTLISPKPVGGKGSIESQHSSETYFFNPGAKFLDSSSLLEPNEPTAPTKREGVKKVRSGLPLLDIDGNSMYLTLSQANKNFRSILTDDTLNSETLTLQSASQISWNDLGITSNQLIKNLDSMACGSPLSIQVKSCASILTGKDIIIGTYTGSGKTLSFLVPLAQRLLSEVSAPNDGVQVLIIAPGRELASQIAGVARSLLEGSGLSTVLAIGGTTFSRNFEQIRRKKPAILVGTPGRIAELVVGQPGERYVRYFIESKIKSKHSLT
jgi:DEAD/DEAH box helicase